MTKRLALTVATVTAAFAAALTGTAANALSDGADTRVTAGDRPVVVVPVTTDTTTSGSGRPKPPTDTSWGGGPGQREVR
ncbi:MULTISPECIES: hypothetical protein [unclassified Streptomyces]|uniref:hypothetical protein n=1 Tax=unclassified Streptomyces TaxID=2593676 RepID=UPI0033B7F8E8